MNVRYAARHSSELSAPAGKVLKTPEIVLCEHARSSIQSVQLHLVNDTNYLWYKKVQGLAKNMLILWRRDVSIQKICKT